MNAIVQAVSTDRSWLRVARQFQGLDRHDPASWPRVPRLTLCLGLASTLTAILWFTLIAGVADEMQAEREQETRLRQDFSRKIPQARNLAALRTQREQVLQQVHQLEKQLPGRAEMDALLSDINQAGIGRGLHFDLFRPGQVELKPYFAEQPIALKVAGRYHDIGAFVADIAGLHRIVTLHQIVVTPGREGALVMEATAKTFRYLDPDEVAAAARAKASATKPAGSRP